MLMEIPTEHTSGVGVAGFGEPPKPDFWISEGTPNKPLVHVAFRVDSKKKVDDFYSAAIAAGAKDNGKPGPRPHYHNAIGAFVTILDGHNIEAVFFMGRLDVSVHCGSSSFCSKPSAMS